MVPFPGREPQNRPPVSLGLLLRQKVLHAIFDVRCQVIDGMPVAVVHIELEVLISAHIFSGLFSRAAAQDLILPVADSQHGAPDLRYLVRDVIAFHALS